MIRLEQEVLLGFLSLFPSEGGRGDGWPTNKAPFFSKRRLLVPFFPLANEKTKYESLLYDPNPSSQLYIGDFWDRK